jgi:thioesterase DpgC
MTFDALAAFDEVTDGGRRELRCAQLAYEAAERFGGLPTLAEMREERRLPQKDKRGLEIAQGEFLARVLADEKRGRRLIHAMGRPRPESLERLDGFRRTGAADLGTATLERRDGVGWITLTHLSTLNAEDDASTANLEIAVDLVLLDPAVGAAVLRGAPMTHPKHRGRRVFGSGINLSDLYQGRISLIEFMLERELGCVSKMYRGLSPAGPAGRDQDEDGREEKPFVAAVDAWAIGGACQWLLVMDAVLAERGAYFNLPARREGIIPGCANLRLPRFVGERAAREAIFLNHAFEADSAGGRLLAGRVVEGPELGAAAGEVAVELTASGRPSLLANRRALRTAWEPIDVFRRYMSTYAREQARCLYSPALIENLERNWEARARSPR